MADQDDKSAPGKIRFHYLKSSAYRVIHVDGAHGGVTPHGYIQMSLLSERHPTPQISTYALSETKRLGEEMLDERVGRDGLIREVEVTALMDYRTAIALRKWLNDRIAELEQTLGVKSTDEH
jgi:hypothetical protein